MKKVLDLIPKATLWVLMIWGLLATLIFFVGGNEAEGLEVAGDMLNIPNFTNMFLFTNYFYFALVLLVTLFFVVAGFISLFKQDKKKALVTLCVLLAIVGLFAACWGIGSGDKLEIIGYEGADNEGFWARLSDMMLYVTYTLFGATLLTIACGWIYTKVKK